MLALFEHIGCFPSSQPGIPIRDDCLKSSSRSHLHHETKKSPTSRNLTINPKTFQTQIKQQITTQAIIPRLSMSTLSSGSSPAAAGSVSNGDGITVVNPVEEINANMKQLIGLWIFFGIVCFIIVLAVFMWLRRRSAQGGVMPWKLGGGKKKGKSPV